MSEVDVTTLKAFSDPENPARAPGFQPARDLAPVTVSGWNPSVDPLVSILDQVAAAGFARVRADRPPTPEDLTGLADLLTLGTPVQPAPASQPGHITITGGWTVLAASRPGEPAPTGSTVAQGWHTDGAAHQLGTIRASMLACLRPAPVGGNTLMFNATAALIELAERDPPAAAALMAPGVLARTTTVSRRPELVTGPAFGVVGGHLLTRYCRTGTERWLPQPHDPQALQRGLAQLDQMARRGSPHYLELTLTAGEVVVLADARICHARTAYIDDPDAPRTMLHGLFATDLVIAAR